MYAQMVKSEASNEDPEKLAEFQARIDADIKIEHDEYGRLQSVGEIEGRGCDFECFFRIFRKKQDLLGIAMRGVGT